LDTTEPNERELQQRLQAGDEAAFDAIFRGHYPHLVRMAESVVRERALAEEISQDVMLELWRRRESLEVQQSLRSYLLRSTRNRALNHVRHERVVLREAAAASIELPFSAPADAELLGSEFAIVVQKAIAALPERSREVFEMSRTQGLRYSEIASALDVSIKTVEKRMGQALAELRSALGPWIGGVKKTST
jgi:RNA polymerase sigma-70 factor (ECF subfamily)